MFTYSWTLCLDENVESAFIVDEAHTIVLKGQLASLLSQFVRRSRKYKNCMFIITQEPRDFADERVLTDGKAVFNNSAYKLVLGLKQDACMELQKLERINESESFWIQHFTQGCALLIVGDRRIPIHVIATKAELTEMGGNVLLISFVGETPMETKGGINDTCDWKSEQEQQIDITNMRKDFRVRMVQLDMMCMMFIK